MTTQRETAAAGRRDWMTLEEMAAELKVPRATLSVWRAKGDFPRSVRWGKHLRVLRDDFDAWVAGQVGVLSHQDPPR